jgi:hypothetical protein
VNEVVRIVEQFKRDLRAQEARQVAEMVRAWARLEDALMPNIELLARELAERGTTVSQAALFRMGRYQTLMAQIQTQWGRYQAYALDEVTAGQRAYGILGIEHGVAAIRASGVAVSATRLPLEAVENLVGLLADGSPLRSLLMHAATQAEAVDGLTNALLQGTALGWNPRKTAREMADKLAGGLDQALTVARTEQMRPYRLMNLQQYRASGVVSGYRRLATRDTRVCLACLTRDGELIPLNREMDEHPNGRCAQVPVVIGAANPTWQTGQEWFRRQDEATQLSILGPGRFAAWQEGQFELSDLAQTRRDATWGDSLQVTPLADLIGSGG